MAITNKPIKITQVELIAEDYAKGLKEKLNESELKTKVEGQGFNTTEDLKETFVEASEFNQKIEDAGYKTPDDLEDTFVKKEVGKGLSTNDYDATAKNIVDNIATTYATKDELNKIGTVKGNATKSQLATLAESANLQDIWCITDDNNHWYMFVGKGADGAEENGFLDLGDHVDVSGKLDTAVAERDYAKKTDLPTDYLTDSDIEDFITESDIVFATDSEVTQAIAAGKAKANQA